MKSISTSELRSRTRSLVRTLPAGKTVSLTHRGKKLAKMWPLKSKTGISSDDPFYSFPRTADKSAKPLTDREIDRIVYGV